MKRQTRRLRQRALCWEECVYVGQDLLARISDRSVAFIRVPRITAGREDVEEWRIDLPATSFRPRAIAAYPPENILALIEWGHS